MIAQNLIYSNHRRFNHIHRVQKVSVVKHSSCLRRIVKQSTKHNVKNTAYQRLQFQASIPKKCHSAHMHLWPVNKNTIFKSWLQQNTRQRSKMHSQKYPTKTHIRVCAVGKLRYEKSLYDKIWFHKLYNSQPKFMTLIIIHNFSRRKKKTMY